MKIQLKKAIEKDIPTLSKIYREEFSKSPYNESWIDEKAIEKMKFFLEFYNLYSIFVDGEIIGFICINPKFMCPGEVAFGEEFAIKEEFQNKGIGTYVLNEIFKIYQDQGFKRFLGIADVNSRANSLYQKLGILPSKKDILIERNLE